MSGTLIGDRGVGVGPVDNDVDSGASSSLGVNVTMSESAGITCKERSEVRAQRGLT